MKATYVKIKSVYLNRLCYAVSIFFLCMFFTIGPVQVFGQEDEEEDTHWFKKQNLFTGGNLNLAFGNQVTVLGINPHFGYSINKFVDVAVTAGYSYTSQRDFAVFGDKVRQSVYGPGAFVRLYPVKFLFAQAQYEYNLIRMRYVPAPNSGYLPDKFKLNASSLLVGGGYCSGREAVGDSFFYLSVLWDVAKAENSPYLDNLRRAVPIIRAGYNIALFQGKSGRR